MYPILVIFILFASCTFNLFVIQLIFTEIPTCGNLLTFSQFSFIGIWGLVFTTRFLTKPPKIPLVGYRKLMLTNAANVVFQSIIINSRLNMALIHLFRASSLIGTLVLGVLVCKKRYTLSKYISVSMITCGLLIALSAPTNIHYKKQTLYVGSIESLSAYVKWPVVVLTLACAMYVQSMLGIQQEVMFKKYGCYPDEAVFYCHVVLLPFYIFLVGDMREQVKHLNNSESMVLVGWSLPRQWVFLVGSVLSNLICIKSIYWLTSCYSSLTVAMIVTLRKFISLIVSLTYFDNIFTFYHWLATFFIFSGTLLFVDEVSTFGDEGVRRALRFGMSCFCGTDGSGRGVSGVGGVVGGGNGNDVAGGGRNGVAAVDGTDDDRSRNGGVVRRRVESGLEDRNTNNSIKE